MKENKLFKFFNIFFTVIIYVLVLYFSFNAGIIIWDLLTSPFSLPFPFEPGGWFYSSRTIYVLRGIILLIIFITPLIMLIKKSNKKKLAIVCFLTLVFDIVYYILMHNYYKYLGS